MEEQKSEDSSWPLGFRTNHCSYKTAAREALLGLSLVSRPCGWSLAPTTYFGQCLLGSVPVVRQQSPSLSCLQQFTGKI